MLSKKGKQIRASKGFDSDEEEKEQVSPRRKAKKGLFEEQDNDNLSIRSKQSNKSKEEKMEDQRKSLLEIY